MSEEEKKDECCCGGHDHEHGEGGCCGGHGHSDGEGCCCEHKSEGGEDFDYAAHDVPLPEPNLVLITTSLAQQAMFSMGILPDPRTGKSTFLMNQARHLIDMIQVIFDKTAGNRTDEETRLMEGSLSDLRMLYVKAIDEKNRREGKK